MHFFIDENLSEDLANTLHHFARICPENHSVRHAIEVNGRRGVPDLEWLAHLQQEGNWVVLSKDRFRKGDPERFAFENAGLSIINISGEWNKKGGLDTALQLIKWWPTISRQVLKLKAPTLIELPWGVSDQLTGRKLGKPK